MYSVLGNPGRDFSGPGRSNYKFSKAGRSRPLAGIGPENSKIFLEKKNFLMKKKKFVSKKKKKLKIFQKNKYFK